MKKKITSGPGCPTEEYAKMKIAEMFPLKVYHLP